MSTGRRLVVAVVTVVLRLVASSSSSSSSSSTSSSQIQDKTDYCHSETFHAECPADEVIVVQKALYGRMRTGHCVQDFGYVGCRVSVLSLADRMCSGRRSCRIQLPNTAFDAVEPCPKLFRSYLEIATECRKVATVPDSTICSPDRPIVVRGPAGLLSNRFTEDRGFGSLSCPWRIEVERGQRINLTLIDFAMPTAVDAVLQDEQFLGGGGGSSGGARVCYQYAIVTERLSSTRFHRVCGGDRRERHVYTSVASVVDIHVITRRNVETEKEYYFLLQYKAIGCPELKAPRHGWLERDQDVVTVGCNDSKSVWRLTCQDNRWIGPNVNCTDKSVMRWNALGINVSDNIMLGVIVALGLGVVIIVLLFTLLCIE